MKMLPAYSTRNIPTSVAVTLSGVITRCVKSRSFVFSC